MPLRARRTHGPPFTPTFETIEYQAQEERKDAGHRRSARVMGVKVIRNVVPGGGLEPPQTFRSCGF